jgi:hypothetical protein
LTSGVAVVVQTAIAVAAFAPDAGAQTPDKEGVSSDDARFDWIDGALARAERPSRRWFTAWTVTYAGLTVGQGGLALALHDPGWRADATIGAIKSSLGLAVILVLPHTVLHARAELRDADASTASREGSTMTARRLRRLRAEELLRASAAEDAFGTSWVPHVAAALTNLAGVYVLFHDYGQYTLGWASLITGTAVAELQIATRPTLALDAWRQYSGGAWVAPGAPSAQTESRPRGLSWSLAVVPAGFAAQAWF